jgi:hypothetical protein
MTQHNKRRGGRRPGSGRHRRRIYLNEETSYKLAELLWQQRNRLKRPELNADEVVRDLIANANEQSRTAYVEVTQLIQEVFQHKWREMEQMLVKEMRSQFDSMYVEMMKRVQEEVLRNWPENDSKTER